MASKILIDKNKTTPMVTNPRKRILIDFGTADRLEKIMRNDESYHQVIIRLLDHYETCPRESCPRKG
ncbi:MAG: hypothetical protein LUQ17_00410 [Methanomicrobiales archaeon]|nr:hypothetical protein [Methanomicrobiales archaeon]